MLNSARTPLQRLESALTWFLPHAHLALLLVALALGSLTLGDYGESWDEQIYVQYGEYGLSAYRYALGGQLPPPYDAFMEQYGPAYVMLGALLSSLMRSLGAAWDYVWTWHALYFLTFLACIELMYQFARRWLSPAASFGTSLLFAAQPLLWGHAFINLKDIPFLTLFLASVHLGFAAVDRLRTARPSTLMWLAAAAVLGITVSIRAGGPWAGLLVCCYAFITLRQRGIPALLGYFFVAAGVTVATWPFLWPAPADRFWQSLQTMSSFPFYMKTQFMGQFFSANQLPWFYIPVVFGIQLTEPILLLFVVGLSLAVWQVLRPGAANAASRAALLLFVGWTVLPVIGILVGGGALYDNARQLFFLLPPLFLLAGIALEALARRAPSRSLFLVCLGLLALPGLWSSRRLHPYEYVYYNSLVGGTGGAYGSYEMDYWATSYADVRDWLNANAPANSRIWVPGGPTYLVSGGLRPDLQISCAAETDCGVQYDFYAALARLKAERRCRGAATVYTVDRQGAVFAVVKQLPEGRLCR